ncbi:MAG: ion transporter [Bacteroidales bacterium]|nr:ion transporter [Bacteroidales bacterium]
MKKILLNEKLLLAIVVLNVLVIFVQECGVDHLALSLIDIVCTLIFVAEMVVKHREYGLRGYWKDGWNVLDGVVTLLSLPALLVYFVPDSYSLNAIIIFRALRVFKLFRTARRFPNLKEIWAGFKLALRQSAGFLLGYFIVIVVIAMFNSALFGKAAPQYFGTPLDAIYAVFQLFTVEGWYEIPNAVVGDMAPVWVHIVRLYFCLLLIGGGIIGMSLINSIFVDALAADNNDDVKAKLDVLEEKLDRLLEEQKKQ